MKKSSLPSLITLLIFTLITAFVWVVFTIYRAFSVKPPPSVPEEVSRPLDPKLDTETLKNIESKIFLDDSQIPEIQVSTTPVPQAVYTPVKTPAAITTPTTEPQTGE